MKVKELIETLKSLEPNAEVIIQRDAEGNGYMNLYGYWTGAYEKDDNQWVGYGELTKELEEQGYTEEDVIPNPIPAVFLWG